MARFLFCTFPSDGHINPGLPIARTLCERGHDVVWYTTPQYQSSIEATGARWTGAEAAFTFNGRTFAERFPEAKALTGLAAFKFGLKHVFIDEIAGQIADVRHILHTFPADVLLGDGGFFASKLLHELGGPPWATYGITALTLSSRDTAPFGTALPPGTSSLTRLRNRLMGVLTNQVLFRDVNAHYARVRRQLGLPDGDRSVFNLTVSPYLYIQGSASAFEYPRGDLAPQVHFVGPLLPSAPADWVTPAWWPELMGRKSVVLVNQGTVATHLDDLVVPTLRALEHEDVLVVVTTGGQPRERLGVELPANARVEPFIPFGMLLPHVDVMVTNGGYGGVQFALSNGVPLVVAGTTEEKPEIAARVAWSGSGIDLKTSTPTPAQIHGAVRAVLDNARYRENARRIQAANALHDAPREAATLLERLATTKQPVMRGEALGHTMPRQTETVAAS